MGIGGRILYLLLGLAVFAGGIAIYYFTYKKCPDFLKKTCILSMVISGLGISMKGALFFWIGIWKLQTDGAEFVTTVDGKQYIVNWYGEVRNTSGKLVGSYDRANQTVTVVE